MTDYDIVIVPLDAEDGGGFLGYVPDLPGCMGDGATRAAALADTEAALLEWLDAQATRGEPVPSPGEAARRAFEREAATMATMRALVDLADRTVHEARETADRNRILERRLAELIALLKDDAARPAPSLRLTFAGDEPARRPRH